MLNSKEVKDYLSHHHVPQLLEVRLSFPHFNVFNFILFILFHEFKCVCVFCSKYFLMVERIIFNVNCQNVVNENWVASMTNFLYELLILSFFYERQKIGRKISDQLVPSSWRDTDVFGVVDVEFALFVMY